jgi:methylthioribose-1-phosphate isomerase
MGAYSPLFLEELDMTGDFVTVAWTSSGAVRLIDQTRLPNEEVYIECRRIEEVAEAIQKLRVRGAPAIGVAAAMGLAMAAQGIQAGAFEEFYRAMEAVGSLLIKTRPTAVNLAWAVRRLLSIAQKQRDLSLAEIKVALVAEAQAMRDEDIRINRAMGRHGQSLVPNPARVLTHCNAGGLATAGYGTAIGVIRAAVEAGKRIMVWVDETRPLLQGARLTAWELQRAGIPATLITDNMAAHFMGRGQVDLVVVGAASWAAGRWILWWSVPTGSPGTGMWPTRSARTVSRSWRGSMGSHSMSRHRSRRSTSTSRTAPKSPSRSARRRK